MASWPGFMIEFFSSDSEKYAPEIGGSGSGIVI